MSLIKNYSRIQKRAEEFGLPHVEVPNLLAMQIESYDQFLQKETHPLKRDKKGLQAVFESTFPIDDPKRQYLLEFVDYTVLKEKVTMDECRERNLTFQAPIKARLKLTIFDEEVIRESGERQVKDVIEQEVFLGEIPLITPQGTFIINGAERVIISQLHRSPGVFFTEERHPSGKAIYAGKVIPYVGSWLEYSLDVHDTMYVHIDKKRKLPVTVLLRSIGLSTNQDIRNYFYKSETVNTQDAKGRFLANTIVDPQDLVILYPAGTEITEKVMEGLFSERIREIEIEGEGKVQTRYASGKKIGEDVMIPKVKFYSGIEITESVRDELMAGGIHQIKVILQEYDIHRKILENTIAKDPSTSKEDAVTRIYNLIRPGENPTVDMAEALVERMFFHEKRYNLGEVGRYKLNERLGVRVEMKTYVLTKDDICAIVNKLIDIFKGEDYVDDIDHLSNRRIRTVGELLEEEYTNGLARVARIVIEKMQIQTQEEITIHDLISSNALNSVVQAFFTTGQLSQFMEQANPLAALTHKRRLSALGPGGLTRDRAGFEVRDVHHSHYGRICPIETPEGPNIGLISSPAIYSRVNRLGFLETPYIRIENGRITRQVDYLVPAEEDKYTIAQANVDVNGEMEITEEIMLARRRGEYVQATPRDVQYMDVSPQQIVSVSASLIPFLEHDDANRALMGSNMQRQAVPLLNPTAPIVGTGMERVVAEDSGVLALAPFDGIVSNVTAAYIDLRRADSKDLTIDLGTENRVYLRKFVRSNQDTCINQRPIVKVGQEVKKGEALTDGPCIDQGRFALGQNMLVSFMPWYGYNYEDAIILSERVAREDILTSIYIEELEVQVRNVKNGKEELAKDIPNVPSQALRNLDNTGIIRVGSVIKAGDIIVGKITPKSVDIDPSPEENLMRALFGDRAGDYTNTSLKAKPGMEGVVIDVKVFSKLEDVSDYEGEKKDELARLTKERAERTKRIEKFLKEQLSRYLVGETAKNIAGKMSGKDEDSDETPNRDHGKTIFYIAPGRKISADDLKRIDFKHLNLDLDLVENNDRNMEIYRNVILKVKEAREESENLYKKARDRMKHGDPLPYGTRKMVKVYIAKKRKIQVGDKMAGRHGNKGVISKIAPIEDMPFLEDGTAIDIILNPLGVPSRMNIGQILETHLGMAAWKLGFYAESPVFDGARIEDIQEEMRLAELPLDGKQVLYDGKSGEPFKERVTVGIIYMLKLNHLVADKMHARSTGPYSLITQQPLGGKAQHGGQRLGEMEVWALEAYGAARLLEEMLTIKSDDVDGRTNTYKAITSGQNPPDPGVPESFNVLVSELKSLCFDIEFLSDNEV